jgi:excinuclease ABC subunit C
MNDKLQEKIDNLPLEPGVYMYKDIKGTIIYVGKAAKLRNRVRQYFQKSRSRDTKTDLLVKDIEDLELLVVGSEIEALFLESEMIKRYMPKYNVLLRDDKHYQYVRIDFKSSHPILSVVRRPLDDGGEYFGPYVGNIRPALKLLRKIFPFDYSRPTGKKYDRASLHYHLGLSPGLEAGHTSLEDYRANLRKLAAYLKGERVLLEKTIRKEMQLASKAQDFERAARKRDQLSGLENLHKQILFGNNELFDISKDQALSGLQDLLELDVIPKRIEGYDISHQSGTNNVASMVVFTGGVSDKSQYRKFKMRHPGNDDFAHMREVISRRFSDKNLENWSKPDLILIDGGKGQVNAALSALEQKSIDIPLIGLAKRFETIIKPTDDGMEEVLLSRSSHVIKLLQRVRDESHRFAVSYHSNLKRKAGTASWLEEIPGVGPATRKKIIKTFGSVRSLKLADHEDIEKALGKKTANLLKQYLN